MSRPPSPSVVLALTGACVLQGHPAIHAAVTSWSGGAAFREALHKAPWSMTTLVYQRDSGSGRVKLDSRGLPRLSYCESFLVRWHHCSLAFPELAECCVFAGVSRRDIESMLRGVELAVRAMVAAGAMMVTLLNNGKSLEYRTSDGGSIDAFMASIRKAGIVRNVTQV